MVNDPEFLTKSSSRPHVLVLSLTYKGKKRNFAVPLRSNIPPGEMPWFYYALPPRATTKPKHRHGLHYIKMFPITKKYQCKFWTGKNPSYVLYQNIISKNKKQIIRDCQKYLNNYEKGLRHPYSVDIDSIIQQLDQNP